MLTRRSVAALATGLFASAWLACSEKLVEPFVLGEGSPRDAGVADQTAPDASNASPKADACAANCPMGAPCSGDGACAAGVCDKGVCAVASGCLALQQARATPGRYLIDPDGPGGNGPAEVHGPTQSDYPLAPVAFCQAREGATPACRSFVAAAGYQLAGVAFGGKIVVEGPLKVGQNLVSATKAMLLTAPGVYTTTTLKGLARYTAQGVMEATQQQDSVAPVGLTFLYSRGLLVALSSAFGPVPGQLHSEALADQESFGDQDASSYLQSASGEVLGLLPRDSTSFARFSPAGLVLGSANTPALDESCQLAVQLARGGYVVLCDSYSSGGAAQARLLFFHDNLEPLSFPVPPTGAISNKDGSLSYDGFRSPGDAIQLPNGMILVADTSSRSLVRITESGDFVDATALEQTPLALLLDTSGKLLIATASGVLLARFGP
jgi:hypothetical protein